MRIGITLFLLFITLSSLSSQAGASHYRELERKLDLLCDEYRIINPAPSHNLIENRSLPDNPLTATYWSWGDVEKNWILQHKEFCTYSPANNLLELINKTWIEDQWKDEYRAFFVYTQENLLRLFQYENWEYNDWHLYTRYINEYDTEDRLISVNLEDWIGKEWIVRSRKLHAYYDQPNCQKITEQVQYHHEWLNEKRETTYYDAQHETKTTVREEWHGGTWEKVYRQQYAYNAAYQLTSILGQTWSADQWIDATQTIFDYDAAGNLIKQQVHLLQPSSGQQDFAWYLQYDENNRLIETALWCKDGNEWNVRSRNVNTYDALGRVLTNLSQVYADYWINADYIVYTYNNSTAIEGAEAELQCHVYPNPAEDVLFISLQDELPEATIQVVSMDGKILTTVLAPPSRQIQLAITTLSPGPYIVQIQLPNKRIVRRFSKT